MYTGKHWFRQSQQELFKFIFWPLPQSFSNLFPQNFKFLWLRNSFSLICLVSTLNRKIDILNFDVLNHRLLQIFKKKTKTNGKNYSRCFSFWVRLESYKDRMGPMMFDYSPDI